MSSFTGEIVLKKKGPRMWEVYTPFEYHVGKKDSGDVITIPKGFTTDLASVPRLFWIILPSNGRYTAAAIVHDYLYFTQTRTRQQSDIIFNEAMKVLKVFFIKRRIMYRAVRICGFIPWNNKKKKHAIIKKKQNNDSDKRVRTEDQ